MAKTRIHELAKELGMNSRDLTARLQQKGFAVKNHMSTLEEFEVKKAKEIILGKKDQQENREKRARKENTKPTRIEDKGAPKPAGRGAPKPADKGAPKPTGRRAPKPAGRGTPKPTDKGTTTDGKNDTQTSGVDQEEFRKRVQARKEEIRRSQEQTQRKLLSKVANISTHGRGKRRRRSVPQSTPESAPKRTITIQDEISVQELANRLHVDSSEVIKTLIELGVMASINQVIDSETALLVAEEFGADVEVVKDTKLDLFLEESSDEPEMLEPRPPVITVMGHVDHGKTSLLDVIRHTDVTATEAGGITQHIGAYQVEIKGKKITFLDTPGHEAFTAMRARGAQITDIAILVVAADDGVMPQTIEAINHAKAAGVPIIVAINKIDKSEANPERIMQQLTEYNLVPEEWGGDTICVPVSAKSRKGLDQLLEMILLVAEIEELKANPNTAARGTVIEAQLDKGRGPVATVLIQKGTLHIGDYILAGLTYGRVRAMLDFKGRRIKKALPAAPVAILGLSEVPDAGDPFYACKDEKLVRQIVDKRINQKRQHEVVTPGKVTLDELFKQIQEGKVKELNLIVKADVQGSVGALIQALNKLSTTEVRINIIHSGVGAITETDIMLASASGGLVIGFNVRPDTNTKRAAETQQVEIRLYRVIYEAIEDVKAALEGLLEPELREVITGRSEVRNIFRIPKVGTIAGCHVTEGKVTRNNKVRVIRDGVVIHDGTIASLKRFKDDVREVVEGHECGIGLERFQDLKEGDILEGYLIEEVKRVLQPEER